MALRLVEITLPSDMAPELAGVLEEALAGAEFEKSLIDGQVRARIIIDAQRTGPVIDAVATRFGAVTGFRLLVLAVEASLPRADEIAEAEPASPVMKSDDGPYAAGPTPADGVSREEMYDDVLDMTRVSRVFVVTVVLSTIVAAVGLLRDNVAVIVGAMVIAPLLGPNVALAFATTLGDAKLIRRSVRANLAGFLVAISITAALGAVYTGELGTEEMLARTVPSPSDIVLALAAGGAAALAVTSGISTALTGVMVAVALLPPTVVAGVMLGAAEWNKAAGAGLLFATNVICVNLAGVVIFVLQGVNPRSWWSKDRARRSVRLAIALWVTLLLVLAALIVLPGEW